MKTIKLFIILLLASGIVNATVRTVNNAGGAQYTDLALAISAAISGDTIYVCGSVTGYTGTATTKTNLVFIGAGYNPQKQNPLKTLVSSSWYFGNGNTIIGFEISNIGNNSSTVSNIKFSRCKINGMNASTTFVNCMFDNCLWANANAIFNGFTYSGCIFSNCIIHSSSANAPFINCSVTGNVTFDHCAFIKEGSPINLFNSLTGTSGFIFTNNIFINFTPPTSGYNFQYTNNYSPANLSPYGTGNITGATWPFVTAQGIVTGTFSFLWDFHLLGGSPLIGAGTFGSEIGLYGGPVPFKSDGEPPIPQIDIMMLNGTQFIPGGTMGVQFQSTIGN